MLIRNLFITLCVFVSVFVKSNDEKNCLDSRIEKHLATKTPYRFINNKNDNKVEFKGCSPTKIWSVIRHGSRNPSRKQIFAMNNRLIEIRDQIIESPDSKICFNDLLQLRTWIPEVDPKESKFLVMEGEDELLELAERFQNRFPDLLSDVYLNSSYRFKYTNTQRTQKSAQSFATGLFGRQNIKKIWYPEPLDKDPILRFYKNCPRWKKDVDKNPASLNELEKFTESNEMKNSIKKLQLKTGLSNLTPSDLKLMYMTCAFETSWNKYQMSPWCSVFDESVIRVMEFREDLEYYWIDGYGFPLTYKQACIAGRDLLDRFDQKSKEPNSTFYFTHSGTILKLLAFFNLYKDEVPLTHTGFNLKRKWLVSKIDTFASNLAFVLFSCEDGPKVLSMHQEQVIHMPNCPIDDDLCDYEKFISSFKNDVENCNFDEICSI